MTGNSDGKTYAMLICQVEGCPNRREAQLKAGDKPPFGCWFKGSE